MSSLIQKKPKLPMWCIDPYETQIKAIYKKRSAEVLKRRGLE